jgi:hypothetical protein
MTNAKQGSLLTITAGEYSDHYTLGFFVILKDFDPIAELTEYLSLNPKQAEEYEFEESEFLQTLIVKGLLLEIEHSEFYLGAYSCIENVRFTPA